MELFHYDIEVIQWYRVINFNHIFSVNGNTNTINIKFNLFKMLSGIDLATKYYAQPIRAGFSRKDSKQLA